MKFTLVFGKCIRFKQGVNKAVFNYFKMPKKKKKNVVFRIIFDIVFAPIHIMRSVLSYCIVLKWLKDPDVHNIIYKVLIVRNF